MAWNWNRKTGYTYYNDVTGAKLMRNVIRILDADKVKPTVASLETGDMFRYPTNSNPQNVYMKLPLSVILLATGQAYSDFDPTREVETISSIQITR